MTHRLDRLAKTLSFSYRVFALLDYCPLTLTCHSSFIDGDHSYEGIKTDWTLWSPLIEIGGIVALHDSRSYEGRNIDHVGATQYTQQIILKDERFQEIDHCDSLTIVQRIE